MNIHEPSAATLELLGKCGTSTIANILLNEYGIRNCYMLGLHAVNPGHTRFVGAAYTLRFIPAREDIDSLKNYASSDYPHRRAIEECPAGHVLVISTEGNTRAASAGDIMVARLKMRGVSGIVTDGGFRDTPAISQIGLPAFQRENAPPASPIALRAVALNEPIGCAGVAVYPGDIIVGDAEGVVVVPEYAADAVAEKAYAQTQYEAYVEEKIAQGNPIFGLFPSTPESLADYRSWVERKQH